ncbi:uncharacterized protein LOC122624041 [Drosophila teissieri]|uniref:uncharacterized protein LOC122624041 n=1 Tax=Drosophila teissieri TaxID=7243 RepID=UPI001CB9E37C|nr:uncharacterized protein LOC122624041 [Drosophila teissieri]
MFPIYAVIVGLTILSRLPQDASGTCHLQTVNPAPFHLIDFGSKHLLSDTPQQIERETGQTIDLLCASGFIIDYFSDYYNEPKMKTFTGTILTMNCDRNGYFTYDGNRLGNPNVHCCKEVSQLFESETSLPNCTDMTLVLGSEFDGKGLIKNAALCYDIVATQLKYIAYTTYFNENRIVAQTQSGQLNDVGLNIPVKYQESLFGIISQPELNAYLAKEKQLFAEDTFRVGSLVQDVVVSRQLAGYENLMTTVWWEELRSGNWKHWTTAMRDAIGVHFDIRLGVSGVLELPTLAGQSCNSSRSLGIALDDGRYVPIPAHIWAHVRAVEKTGTGPDEFVIIGHNSPFYRSGSSDLCPSMCNQVSWLRNSVFASLHEFPALGMVQCCRVEDVAHKLDNFPGPFGPRTTEGTGTAATTTPKMDFPFSGVLGTEV